MLMSRGDIGRLAVIFIFLWSSVTAGAQEFTLERVRTPESIPGWGTPLVGGESVEEYTISFGDELSIFVWKNADLSRKVTVRNDGKISYPLIGAIQAAGLTIEELQEVIKRELSKFARSPEESVIEAGDKIEIFVWKNPDFTRTVRVRKNGNITYPLIGTIRAAGLTVEELEEKIEKELFRFSKPTLEDIIEPGDELEIFVWKNEDLTRTITVRRDGKITFPLIGTIPASGLNVEQLQAKVEQELSNYIKFPDVTVTLRKIGLEKLPEKMDVMVSIVKLSSSKIETLQDVFIEVTNTVGHKVIVFGEVAHQGVYLYKGTLNLLEAIAMAGGVKESGKRESIIVVSGNMTDSPQVRRVNLFRVLRKGSKGEELVIRPNDVIYVPRHFFADLNRFHALIDPSIGRAFETFDWRDKIRPWVKGLDTYAQ